MSECIDDMTALSQLKDNVVDIIRHDPNPLLQKSKDIFRRIDERQLVSMIAFPAIMDYHCVTENYSTIELIIKLRQKYCQYSYKILNSMLFPFLLSIQYSCIGKTSFTRENQIFGMTESEIEKALLSQQGPRIAFNASSGTGAGGEIYHRSHHEALDFVGEEEEIDENDGNFCDTPDSLFRLSHAGRYSRLRGDESCGARGQEFECSHQMSMCRLEYGISKHVCSLTFLQFNSFIISYLNTTNLNYSLNSFLTYFLTKFLFHLLCQQSRLCSVRHRL